MQPSFIFIRFLFLSFFWFIVTIFELALHKMDDRISELPDDILSDILTRLSMKDLLKTSILSRRWCNLWSLRRDLYFDLNVLGSNEKELRENGYLIDVHSRFSIDKCVDLYMSRDEFVKRVDQFVKNFSGTKINSFLVNFYLNCEQSYTIDQWISFAIARGVGRIDLLFLEMPYTAHPNPHPDPSKRYKFSFDLFSDANASALKHLRLECCILCNPTNSDFIPFKNLISLSLVRVKVDEMLIEILLSDCQLLEDLCLLSCEFKSSTPKIVSSSLCHLKVSNCYKVSNNSRTRVNLMLVDCFKLTSLEYHGEHGLYILNINTPVLKSINSSILLQQDLNSFALCATFPELEIMHLDIYVKAITSLKITQPLKHLKQMDFIIDWYPLDGDDDDECDLLWILLILKASPLLQKLSIMFAYPKLRESQKDIRDVGVFSQDEIKVIEFGGCVGNWFEIEFVLNVIKYDKLEQIVVSPYWRDYDSNQQFDPVWFQSGREKMSQKLQDEAVVGREKVVLL